MRLEVITEGCCAVVDALQIVVTPLPFVGSMQAVAAQQQSLCSATL